MRSAHLGDCRSRTAERECLRGPMGGQPALMLIRFPSALLGLQRAAEGLVAVAGYLARLLVRGEFARLAVALDVLGELVTPFLVHASLVAPDLGGIRAEWTLPVHVEPICEPVALDLFSEPVPLLGELHAGDGPLADQLAHMLGRLGDGQIGLPVDLQLAPVRQLRGRGELRDELLAVLSEPLVGMTARRVQSFQLELDPLRVCGVADGMLALKRGVAVQLSALVTGAPAALLRLRFELHSAVGLLARGLLVMSVFLFQPDRVSGGLAVQLGDHAAGGGSERV